MRKLMWFTIGFAVSCALCAYVLVDAWIVPAAYAAVAVTALVTMLMLKWKSFRFAAMTCFGCALGMGWFLLFHSHYLAVPIRMDGAEQFLTVTATDYSYETDYGLGVDGAVVLNGKTYQVRTYLDEMDPLNPGDRVEGMFRMRVTTPDGEKGATYHQGKGIFLIAYQRGDVSVSRTGDAPRWAFAAQLRQKIKAALENCFSADTAAFAKGLLLGDTTDFSYEIDTDFKISGIRHVVAVSGLHISILFALISMVTFRKRYLTALLGFPMLVLFAAVAGFTPSVCRACLMSSVMLLSGLLEKEYDGPTALSFAALVILLVNPLTITSVSFQLSVASVAGIFLFREGIQNWMLSRFGKLEKDSWKARLVRWFSSSVAITLSAMSLTTPLCAYYFGTVSLVGVLTNLLTLWIISFVFYGLMAVCAVYFLWQGGAVLLAQIVSIPIRYVLAVSAILADFPFAAVYTHSAYIIAWLAFAYLLLLVFLFQKNRKPGLLGCCAVIGLCLALMASWLEPLMDDARVTVLDVGQGQAILLQSEGRTILVDCGGDSDEEAADIVAGKLLSQGITRLDGIILTHYDADHAGGLENLLTRIQTDLLLVPDTMGAKPYPQVESTVCYVDEDMKLSFGGAEITVFGPIYSGDDNENSLCILFETENCAILVTGDRTDFGERMLLRHAELPNVDLLIAGHHGAKTSTSLELLEAVKPETVIISVGEGNYYGHPHEELLLRLAEFGCSVYRTDIYGTIVYRR